MTADAVNGSEPSLDIGLSWRMRQHEARLLADSMRSSRLTLLYAGAGATRRELLSEGVLPLLGRREADVGGDALPESRLVEPFVDRRETHGAGTDRGRCGERTVTLCAWSPDPLAGLLDALRAAVPARAIEALASNRLVDVLETVCERLDTRVLVVLDDFEKLWTAGAEPSAVERFVEALGEAVNRPRLSVNFLIVADDRCEARLEFLRRPIPRFDDSTVRLMGFERSAAAPVPIAPPALPGSAQAAPRPNLLLLPTLSNVAMTPGFPRISPASVEPASGRSLRKRRPKVPRAPPEPIKRDGVYAFIESTLTQTADASKPWSIEAAPPASEATKRDPADSGRAIGTTARDGRSGLDSRAGVGVSLSADAHEAPVAGPPSPIDDWLDLALTWWRRLFRFR